MKHEIKWKFQTVPVVIAVFLLAVVLFYAVAGGDARIEIHDDLDLFPSQYMILKNTGTFFKHGVNVPFLGGIDRNYLPSELSLVALCYMIFPGLAAHVAMYVCKVVIAVLSFYLLAQEIVMHSVFVTATDRATGETVEANTETRTGMLTDVRDRALLCGLAYGMLNLFPHFGIAFASVPLVLFLLFRIYRCGTLKKAKWWYAPLFLYPFVSYFSYFGFFILAYLALYLVVRALRGIVRRFASRGDGETSYLLDEELYDGEEDDGRRRRRFPVTLLVALFVLAAGYVVFEYRLFQTMLFSGVPTIRDTMSQADSSLGDALRYAFDLFVNGNMHTTSVQKYFVLPVCIFYITLIIIRYSASRYLAGRSEPKEGATEETLEKPQIAPERVEPIHAALLVCFAVLLLNCLIGGLAVWAPFRNLVEAVFPFLKGFQFGRTYFFNPFLWYVMLCLVAFSVSKKAGTGLIIAACVVALVAPVPYNSLFYTAYEQYYRANHDGQPTDNLTYGDFYAEDLFEHIKEDMGYDARDFAVAYGLYPSVLQYNGIATIDGYLGYYPLAYKALFRAAVAPALAVNETARDYFDRFGGRCYLYSATDEQGAMQYRTGYQDDTIRVDTQALRDLGCHYVFSRVRLSNADESGLRLAHAYEENGQPYEIYVYVVE